MNTAICPYCQRALEYEGQFLPLHTANWRTEIQEVNPIACRGSRTTVEAVNPYEARITELEAALREIYDELPTTSTIEEFRADIGNWGLTDTEIEIAKTIRRALNSTTKGDE